MSNIIRIDSYNKTPSLGKTALDSIEWFVMDAYIKSFYYYKTVVPEFFDVFDLFIDSIYDSCRQFFVSDIYGIALNIDNLSMELVQDLLMKEKVEFISMEGEHLGDCQNILFEDWWDE